jgi:HlyD family secretion protein
LILAVAGFALLVSLYFVVTYWHHKHNKDSLILYGNVDIRQVDLGFRVAGRLEKMVFEEGDIVKTGDTVAILDKAPYEANLAAAKAQLLQAAANFAKFKHGNRPQEIEEARANVRQLQAAYDNAVITLTRQNRQLKVDATSKQAYDDALAKKLESEAQLKSAEEALSLAEEGFRLEDIDGAQAALETAKAQLISAQINLNDTTIFSPSDGIILTRVREPGAIVDPQSIVYTLSLHKPVWVRAYVSETDLGRIKPGMQVLITTDANPDKPFKGQIGFISPQAEFTPKTVETPELRTDLVYRLRIVADDPKSELRQGMPVTIKIQLSS